MLFAVYSVLHRVHICRRSILRLYRAGVFVVALGFASSSVARSWQDHKSEPANKRVRTGGIMDVPATSILVCLHTETARSELRLTNEQCAKIKDLRQEFFVLANQAVRQYYKHKESPDPQFAGSMEQQIETAAASLGTRAMSMLSWEQIKRFQELEAQAIGPRLFELRKMQDILGLSDSQKR